MSNTNSDETLVNALKRIDELEEALEDCMFVHDTFSNDLARGYITKDKEFAVDLMSRAKKILEKSK